jgi:hypothetical protein
MFDFVLTPVPVRSDIVDVFRTHWAHLASPGATLDAHERISVAAAARRTGVAAPSNVPASVLQLASTLMSDPAAVDESLVRSTAESVGDPMTVETIAIVSQLSAVDGFHTAMGLALEPFPIPEPGHATGEITPGLKRRRTHVPMPAGPIPVALDLVPAEGLAMEALAGPLYMTYDEMAYDDFKRTPGLTRAQIELVSSRLSVHNECFY